MYVRYFIAITLIGIGTMLVLDNLGIIDSDIKELWYYIYPVFLMVIGITFIFRYVKRGGAGWIFGPFLLIFGILLLLGKLQVIDYRFSDIFKLWPLLFIYIGFSLIGKTNKRNKKASFLKNDHSQFDSESYDTCFSAGDHEYKEKH